MNEKDYVLGWLACDGSLEKNGITVSLQIQSRDAKVLNSFVRCFGAGLDNEKRTIAGRDYCRARLHSKRMWRELASFFGGRLKLEKRFPENASIAFVVGCLDADGSFYLHHGRVTGMFQHRSPWFLRGIRDWFRRNGFRASERTDRNWITFGPRDCQKLLSFYEDCPFALERKRDVLRSRPAPSSRWWTGLEVAHLLLSKESDKELALRFGVSEKAVQLKKWKLNHNVNRTESVSEC